MTYWKDYCFDKPPPHCDGWLEAVPGQCCPACRQTLTTPVSTTPIPEGACYYKGQMFHHSKSVSSKALIGVLCDYGVIRQIFNDQKFFRIFITFQHVLVFSFFLLK